MQIERETVKEVTDFYFWGLQITADSDCSHEIKRCFLLGRKAMTNLDSILKSKDITLLTKVCIVKAMAFPGVMYRCESWTIRKSEHRRMDMNLSKLWDTVKDREGWHAAVHRVTKSQTRLNNWTTTMRLIDTYHTLDINNKGFPGGSVVKNLPASAEVMG